jgi:hypothetical protein
MCKPRANYVVVVEGQRTVAGAFDTFGEAKACAEAAVNEYPDNAGTSPTVTIYQAAALIGERRTVDVLWTPTAAGVL